MQHSDTDDSDIELSADVLAMVNEVRSLQAAKENDAETEVPEDWGLSQFWYTNESVTILVNEILAVLASTRSSGRIACLSCPSLFRGLTKAPGCYKDFHPYLFERATRTHFVFFDYNKPRELPADLRKSFDVVIADPPHLAQSCMIFYAMAIRELMREDGRSMFCTGQTMAEVVYRCLGCRPTTFKPQHERKLGNEFGCFTDYRPLTFNWLDEDPNKTFGYGEEEADGETATGYWTM
ncbi:Protein-lysine N-methyltransferase N6AMT2-like protein [Aphelenchoides fujianensis]|nr:Protein-lysine N-methyltransferase N6AMT2-like protein [Aphelenchoides fujianensis]